MSDIWEKYYCVVVNDILQSVTLHEFEMNDNDVQVLKSGFIYEDEYPEYISDSDNWIPLKRFVNDIGRLNHWSGITTIRMIEKIIEYLMIVPDEEIAWIYRSIENGLDVIYYSDGKWWSGYITGSQFSWTHSTSHIIKNLETVRNRVNMYIPLKRYVELYIKERYFLNDTGVQRFVNRTKEYLRADGVWVDDSISVTGGGGLWG